MSFFDAVLLSKKGIPAEEGEISVELHGYGLAGTSPFSYLW